MEKLEILKKKFDKLQNIYGSKQLNSVYGCGCANRPKVALVFMNPTAKNIATDKAWTGLRAQWLGTKQIWDFLVKCGLFDSKLNEKIKSIKPHEWTPEFCQEVYDEISSRKVWITNLAKCAQDDARPLSNKVFLQYKDLLKEELGIVDPEKIVFFGNQVSSIMLDQSISVSTARKQKFLLMIDAREYESYAVFYPVGNGRFNQPKAVEDIMAIAQKF